MRTPAHPTRGTIARSPIGLGLGLGLGLCAELPVALAQPAAASLAEVVVAGERGPIPATRVTEAVAALPASTTVLERRDLDRRTIATYGDLFRDVGGISVADYGQGLVAYEIKLRGFASGHGRDVAFFLDGMPLNVTGSQHTNGYADLAAVIPELLSRIEIVRGPFSVLAGNHAVGGSVQLFTEASPRTSVSVSGDRFGRVRMVPIANLALGPGQWLIAADLTRGAGSARQGEAERHNLFTRVRMPLGEGIASVRLQAYDARADAPGYLDLQRIRAGSLDPRAALSPGIGDAKRQQLLVAQWVSNDVEGSGEGAGGGWFVSFHANRDERRRWSNFDLSTQDVALVVSSSGCNVVPIEMAQIFRERGIKVVAIVFRVVVVGTHRGQASEPLADYPARREHHAAPSVLGLGRERGARSATERSEAGLRPTRDGLAGWIIRLRIAIMANT